MTTYPQIGISQLRGLIHFKIYKIFFIAFVIILMTCFENYSQIYSSSYEKLKKTVSKSNDTDIYEYLKSLPTDSLYMISELSSIDNNDSILF